MPILQHTAIALVSSTVKLSFTLTDRYNSNNVSSLTSSTLTAVDQFDNSVLSVTSLTSEGSGVFSYEVGPTVFTNPGLYTVTLVAVADTGETVRQQFTLLAAVGF